jgi:hypothetical protein
MELVSTKEILFTPPGVGVGGVSNHAEYSVIRWQHRSEKRKCQRWCDKGNRKAKHTLPSIQHADKASTHQQVVSEGY